MWFRNRKFNGIKLDAVEETFINPCHGIQKYCCESSEDLYRLKNRGILKELPNGGYAIEVNSQSTHFRLPSRLKNRQLSNWPKEDKVWLNM